MRRERVGAEGLVEVGLQSMRGLKRDWKREAKGRVLWWLWGRLGNLGGGGGVSWGVRWVGSGEVTAHLGRRG